MKNIAYISLGSNMGERYNHLLEAIQILKKHDKITLVNTSSIYETDPVGYTEQNNFLNMVIQVATSLTSTELLDICLNTEQSLGRKREIKWGPRTIDLDILLFNQENIETEKLIVPHPRMHERAFVLIPLLEIDPDLQIPKMNLPLRSYLEVIPDKEGVWIWKQKNGEDVFALFEN